MSIIGDNPVGHPIEDPKRGIGKVVAGPLDREAIVPFFLVEFESWRDGHNADSSEEYIGYRVTKRDYRHWWLSLGDILVFNDIYWQIDRDAPIDKIKRAGAGWP